MTVSADGNDITVSEANLHIVNGLGAADAKPLNGLGSLIVGNQNNFSSYAGICVGNYSTAGGREARVGG